MASADNVCYVEVLGFGFARFFVVVCASWPPALLAMITLGANQVRSGYRISPPLVLYGALAALRDGLGCLYRMLAALILNGVVGKKCITTPFHLASALHTMLRVVGTAAVRRSRGCT